MKYILHSEPDYYKDSMNILEAIINESSAEQIKNDMVKKYARSVEEKEELDRIYKETSAIEEYVRQKINFDISGSLLTGRETAEFLYRKRDYTDKCPAATFYFYDQMLAHSTKYKVIAILVYALEDSLWENKSDAYFDELTETELFRLVDTAGFDAAAKYEVLKLYLNFDAYYDYNTQLVSGISNMIKEKCCIFEGKIDRFMNYVGDELSKKGLLFFKDCCGVEINDNAEYDIFFSIYCLNGLWVYGSCLTKNRIHAGVCLFDLMAIIKDAKPYKDILAEFIKILADNTKLSILRMLNEESCYGGQLADKLGLTGATISYHMAALSALELVLIRKDSVKVYYSLNKEKIQQYFDGMRTILFE